MIRGSQEPNPVFLPFQEPNSIVNPRGNDSVFTASACLVASWAVTILQTRINLLIDGDDGW